MTLKTFTKVKINSEFHEMGIDLFLYFYNIFKEIKEEWKLETENEIETLIGISAHALIQNKKG